MCGGWLPAPTHFPQSPAGPGMRHQHSPWPGSATATPSSPRPLPLGFLSFRASQAGAALLWPLPKGTEPQLHHKAVELQSQYYRSVPGTEKLWTKSDLEVTGPTCPKIAFFRAIGETTEKYAVHMCTCHTPDCSLFLSQQAQNRDAFTSTTKVPKHFSL